MAGRLNMVMLMIMVVASMQLQASMAQTRHTVGDSNGWNVPSTASVYSTWASTQTFTAGDSLVFTFVTGAHNVAEVTQSAYDACNGTSPISLTGNGPATINLPAAGTRYFICTVGSHCSLGQKVAINVIAVTRRGFRILKLRAIFRAFGKKKKNNNKSPRPKWLDPKWPKRLDPKWPKRLDPPTTSPPAAQPSAPPSSTPTPVSPPPSATTPTSTPAPTEAPASPPVSTPTAAPVSPPVSTQAPAPGPASRGSATYIVGDGLGWTVPPTGGAATYRTWASDKTFVAGDVLVFNFVSQAHNVAEVPRTAFDSCNTTSTIRVISNSPARITLTGGSHYFICTFPQHCSLGQQLAINVTGSATATPPTSIATPPSTPSAQSPDGVNAPPPPNSASSVAAAAALPVGLLSIALAFLY